MGCPKRPQPSATLTSALAVTLPNSTLFKDFLPWWLVDVIFMELVLPLFLLFFAIVRSLLISCYFKE